MAIMYGNNQQYQYRENISINNGINDNGVISSMKINNNISIMSIIIIDRKQRKSIMASMKIMKA
jgi:hypothetical protein